MKLKDIFAWIGHSIGKLWDHDVAPALREGLNNFFAAAMPLALEFVEEQAGLHGKQPEDKFQDAVKKLGDKMLALGWQVGTSALRAAIENAYLAYEAKTGKQIVKAAPPPG